MKRAVKGLKKSTKEPKQLKLDFSVNIISNYIKERESYFASTGK